jgi:hypothetical protein
VGWLAHDDLEMQLAAARALDRITGAAMLDTVEIPPEETVPRELPEQRALELAEPARREAPPLAREVSSPRDAPSEGSSDTMEVASIDPDRWSAWWRDNQRNFDGKHRHRRGRVHALTTCLEELDGPTATPAERQLLHLELCGGTRRYVHLDVDDFVATQEQALTAWRTIVRN